VQNGIRTIQDTNDRVAHAHCMLYTLGYKYSVRISFIIYPLCEWLRERAAILR